MSFAEWFNSWGLGPELTEEQKKRILGAAARYRDATIGRMEVGSQPFFPGHHCGMKMVRVTFYRNRGKFCVGHQAENEELHGEHVDVCPCCLYTDWYFPSSTAGCDDG